ncbi:MAG: SirB2 family protein [Fulvimonas sp.]|nr:SirB2 family protein [Fulvimonas sp.]
MIEFYPQIRWLHVACVLASGGLFTLRGLLVQCGLARVALALPLRWLSYAIDTTLLTAALMLLAMLPHALFANGWLAVKLVLVAGYIVLGALALGRARSTRARRLCYAAALLTYVNVLGIAHLHHPLGWLYGWLT